MAFDRVLAAMAKEVHVGGGEDDGSKAELAAQIAKQRREKRDLALKNLPKAKRRALTHKK